MKHNHLTARLRPIRRAAISAAVAALAASATLTTMAISPAAAETPNPVPAGLSTVASTAIINTNVANATTALTANADGTPVTINITASGAAAGKLFSADARLCKPGINITNQAQFNPTLAGLCVNAPISANSDDFLSTPVGSTPNLVSFNFRVGTGTQTYTFGSSSTTITCDFTHPCSIWLKIAVDTSYVSTGQVYEHYDINYVGPPGAPTGVTATAGDTTGSVSWTPPVSNGGAPVDQYTVTLTSSGAPITQTVSGSTTTANFTGLTNFTTYTATVTARNTAADNVTHTPSAPSSGAALSPGPAPVTGLAGAPGNNKVDLTWNAPAGAAPTNYTVTIHPVNPAGADTVVPGVTTTSYSATGLTNGNTYNFTVVANYSGNPGQPATIGPIAPAGALITQTITVRRPAGALVLTQICGNHAARPLATPPVAAATGGTAPTVAGGGPDPLFGQYPYPSDVNGEPIATYPTDCGIALGTAKFITSGPGAGQYFQANGLLNQVTVVDTRDGDPGWTASGQMGTFSAGGTKTFGGNQLGWTPLAPVFSPPFTDGSGNSYAMAVAAGAPVAPSTVNSLGSARTLAQGHGGLAAVTTGTSTVGALGIAVLDADLKLLIPVFAKTGNYTGVLTLTAV